MLKSHYLQRFAQAMGSSACRGCLQAGLLFCNFTRTTVKILLSLTWSLHLLCVCCLHKLTNQKYLQSVVSGCVTGFVNFFLKVPLACLGSTAAARQPNSLWNSPKTFYKTFFTRCCLRVYSSFAGRRGPKSAEQQSENRQT